MGFSNWGKFGVNLIWGKCNKKTEELHIELPQAIIDELNWEDGTVVEWEVQADGLIALRNIEGIEL